MIKALFSCFFFFEPGVLQQLCIISDHNKPIVLLNSADFYEGLKIQLQKMEDEGFMHRPLDELIFIADTPSEAIDYINQHVG